MPISSDHATHDATLVAGHAAGDLVGTQLLLADRLLAGCAECTRLHADLQAIAAATRSLPPSLPARSDFRITPERASRLRRGSLVRRLLRPFANPSNGLRPLASTFSGLGAIGLAVVLLLPAFGGAAMMSGPSGEFANLDRGATAAPQVAPEPGGGAAAPSAGVEGYGSETAAPAERPADATDGKTGGEPNEEASFLATWSRPSPATLALIASAALLAVGLALFALQALARRIT